MLSDLHRLGENDTLEDAVNLLMHTSQQEFPVVDGEQKLLGVLTRDGLLRALREKGTSVFAVDCMQRDLPVIEETASLDEAFRKMQSHSTQVIPVCDRFQRFTGLITPAHVGELMMVRSILPEGELPSWHSRNEREETAGTPSA